MRRALVVVALAGFLAVGGCDPEAAIRAAWWDASPAEQEDALEVARCESGLDPEARNGPHRGLFQLNERYHGWRVPAGWPIDSSVGNAVAARALQREQGWRPWSCRPS